MKNKIDIFVIVVLIFESCIFNNPYKKDHIKKISREIKVQQDDSLILQWRNDSLGCKKIRNYEMAVLITRNYDLTHKSTNGIIDLLGKPNKIIGFKKNGVILRYYYDSCCQNGKVNYECDYSTWEFVFADKNERVSQIGGVKM